MSLQVLVNGFDLTNGITHRINWVETSGLFDPAALVDPEVVDTFDGPYRVRQTTTNFGSREVLISGSLIVAAPDYASKLRALDGLQMIYAARPSRVMVGTLELQVDFSRVEVAQDQLKRLNGMIKYTVRGTAIPATFGSTCGSGTGYTQGVPVDTSRVNEAATLASMATGVGTITNPGDVPVAAVLTIQGAASTVYYLATSATGRRVPISTDAAGVGRLDERAGLYLSPGVNRITAYSAATGTTTLTSITVMSFFGTAWQFSGNQAAGTATRMDLGPALTVNRTGSATYSDGALIQTAADDVPRIGWSWINRRNLFIDSNDLSSSLSTTRTGIGTNVYQVSDPDGGSRAYRAISNAADSSITHGTSKLTSGAIVAGIQYTFSVWLRSTGSNNTITAFIYDNTSNTTASWSVTSSWTRFSITRTVANTSGFGFQIGGSSSWSTGEGIEIYGPQFEIGSTATAYQATDGSGIALDHPANDGGLVLEGSATNLCLRSQDFISPTWTITGLTSTTGATAPDNTSTAYEFTSTAADSSLSQIIGSLSIGTTYTFSVWMRTTSGSNTVNLYLSDGGAPVFTACNVTTTWTRFTVNRTIAATPITIQIGGANTWSTGEVIQIWGAQLESGTAATSYIATTTASVTRNGEISGIVSPHNLALYSDTQTNAAWSVTGWTVSATPQAGPVSSLLNAYRVTTTATSADNMRQVVTIPAGQAGGKVYTFSVWLRQQGATVSSVVLHIENQAGTSRGNVTASLSGTWQRFSVTATMAAADTDVIVKIRTANAAGTIDVYGAQLTEGYLPGRYIRTTDTQVLPTTMIDPSWSQNGYIEFDITDEANYVFGDGIGWPTSKQILLFYGAATTLQFNRYDSSSSARSVSYSSFAVGESAKVRLEWTNYILGGSRFMFLRLYTNGTLRQETNFSGTAGSSWPTLDTSSIGRMRSGANKSVVSNLVLGTPALPEGARAAGI